MAIDTKISWTQVTWNIARGCTKVDADCLFCYMYRESLDGTRYEPKQVTRTKTVFNLPLKIKEPSKIFCSSLTDVFHEDIDPYRFEAFDIMRRCPQHTFQVLTKRPERIPYCLELALDQAYKNKLDELAIWLNDWIEGNPPSNIWLGTSAGCQESAETRIPHLLRAPAAVRFLSCEPMYGPVDLHWLGALSLEHTSYFDTSGKRWYIGGPNAGLPMLDWVVCGGESGNENGKYRYRPCEVSWIKDLVKQCDDAGVAVWVKQMGTHLSKQLKLKDRHGADISEWPEYLQIQQFPESKV